LVNFFDKGEDQLDEEGVDGQQLGDDEVNNWLIYFRVLKINSPKINWDNKI
jgi:hypothetical protein